VEPAAFGFNAETAATNRFQQPDGSDAASAAAAARAEFGGLVGGLRAAGIPLAIAPDSAEPVKPDAVFPNNWVSFHADGTVVLYPMRDPTRRAERREAVLDCVKAQLGFNETRRIDLSGEERRGRYLEGTGSLVLDHGARVAYACRSPRTDEALVREWARLLDYEPFLFDAASADGTPVYHTNVVLWIGAHVAGAGLDWVAPAQRAALADRLGAAGHALLRLSGSQLQGFAGNMLEVPAPDGTRRLVMSARAAGTLTDGQRAVLQEHGSQPLVAAVPTIERLGGGSVRCMLAEVPLGAA
jgi:hypothetical protein